MDSFTIHNVAGLTPAQLLGVTQALSMHFKSATRMHAYINQYHNGVVHVNVVVVMRDDRITYYCQCAYNGNDWELFDMRLEK